MEKICNNYNITKKNILPEPLATHPILGNFEPTGKIRTKQDGTEYEAVERTFKENDKEIEIIAARPLKAMDKAVFGAICALRYERRDYYTKEINGQDYMIIPLNDIIKALDLNDRDTKNRRRIIEALYALQYTHVTTEWKSFSKDNKKIKVKLTISLIPTLMETTEENKHNYGRGDKKTFAIQLHDVILKCLDKGCYIAFRNTDIVMKIIKSELQTNIYDLLSLRCAKGQPHYRRLEDFMAYLQLDYQSETDVKKLKKALNEMVKKGIITYDIKKGIKDEIIELNLKSKFKEAPIIETIENSPLFAAIHKTITESGWLQEIKNILNS